MKKNTAYSLLFIAAMLITALLSSCKVTVGEPKYQCVDYKVLDLEDDIIFNITELDSEYHVHDTINLDGSKFLVLQVRKH